MSRYIKLEDAIERRNQLYHGYEAEDVAKRITKTERSQDEGKSSLE